MRRTLIALLTITTVLVTGTQAAQAVGLPETRLRLDSVVLEPGSGAIVVTARTRCTGDGNMRWKARASQRGKHDRASINVPCDGTWRTQQLRLESRSGKFHAGNVVFSFGDIVCGTNICIGAMSGTQVRLIPHRPIDPF